MTADNIRKAQGLARLGIYTFPVYVRQDPDNPYRTTKRPITKNGFYDATIDPYLIEDLFTPHPQAEVGVWMGASGLVAGDIDVKRAPDGEILVDGWENFELSFEDLPPTFDFDSISNAGGKQFIYAAPEGLRLGPASNYRGIQGVDRRGGDSYSVWAGGVPASRDAFSPAPEWLLDEKTLRSLDAFEGSVKEWYDTLEPGEPNLLVRNAIERARKVFQEGGNDFSHSDIVERQFEAVRLGAEGNPGVPELLEVLEDLTMSREGEHTRSEDEWAYEFQEALASGVKNYGDAIELRKSLPAYDISTVPSSVPDRLISGPAGDREVFRELLAEMIRATDDDLQVLSIMWNSPRTRDISREWGLPFVHERVKSAREKPEPVRENPTLEATPEPADQLDPVTPERKTASFLTEEETARVESSRTFVNDYLEGSLQKGFSVWEYDVPGAFTALSMAVGTRATTAFHGIGTNLWFIQGGNTGTGKTQSRKFLKGVMDIACRDEMGSYNVGAESSPTAIHEELLLRDGLASMISHDEAATFFSNLNDQKWFKVLEHFLAGFYDGEVEPSNKVRLPKELRGKSARTSFNINMAATPKKLFALVTTAMFESGFLARVNWTWAPDREHGPDRYKMGPTVVEADSRTHPVVKELAVNFRHASRIHDPNEVIGGTPEAWERLSKANQDFDEYVKRHEKYDVIMGPLRRITESLVKCAALFALYRGETEFTELDAIRSIYYVQEWFHTMLRVIAETSESEFSRDMNEIEAYIKSQNGSVTEAKLNNRFRAMIQRSPRELEDRISFLRSSGRINREESGSTIKYVING